MKVIQSFQTTHWTKLRGSESVFLEYPLRKVLLAASVTSWMRFAPEVERVLYVDQVTYDILNSWKWISLWNRVEVVDFAKRMNGIKYYAASKPYTWTLQTEPYWNCDLDCFLIREIPDLGKDTWYGSFYTATLDSDFSQTYLDSKFQFILDSSAKFIKRKGINSGFTFCPKPEVGRILGLALLGLCNELQTISASRIPGDCTRIYKQEAAYLNFLQDLGEKVENIEDGSFFYHHPNGKKDLEELDLEEVEKIKGLLGYDPVEAANLISNELSLGSKKHKNIL